MDAVKFIKELRRMCTAHTGCESCPAERCECQSLENMVEDNRIVAIVEEWSAAHPVTTRAALFKKIFPDAVIDHFGSLAICPAEFDKNEVCDPRTDCDKCRKNYWLKEVQNGS